ncbi:GmhA [Desulforapulum autotrophicum HRM2]|uniref:Phosphoheptose isomerase n=1 Tax=Desulforapulum autotrophicum (strain ATCC 43914 / DSM 3382 / VKM B-1955 / HRM2) TaxID=177437 RepID=C0Q9T9_DESAH|nr:D-sedoheptulose 7-phosphate isomerase [Desulforapulum autotrophicum]ACN16657.1 GmhA [Desulforapulum autotrophicum HRM2]
MKKHILDTLEESLLVKKRFISTHTELIEQAIIALSDALERGNKLLVFGNGGSAADAQHIAAEFINRFQMERPPLAAIALTCDTSVITSIGNDYSFEDIFLKQLQALGRPGDVAMAITTSGNSPNVIKAVKAAKSMGVTVMGLSGPGGQLKELADFAFAVDATATARIQETHITLAHIICDLTERRLFNG